MSKRLLDLAALQETTVTIEGETLRVREPNGLQMLEYRNIRSGQRADPETGALEVKPNLVGAVAHLVHHCVIDADGNPVYTKEEALKLAGGHSVVSLPLLVAVTGFDRNPEKKS